MEKQNFLTIGISRNEIDFLEKFNDSFKLCIVPFKGIRNNNIVNNVYIKRTDFFIGQSTILSDFFVTTNFFEEYNKLSNIYILTLMKNKETFFFVGDAEFSSSLMISDLKTVVSHPMSRQFAEIFSILLNSSDTELIPFEDENSHAYYLDLKESKKQDFSFYDYIIALNEQIIRDNQ
jgi:hypothetical protein